ncbi:hypothetical protein A7982_13135 [Minicystis rosea]|nr:hypothetical protein A7982_13135 [Minicystis rosea]
MEQQRFGARAPWWLGLLIGIVAAGCSGNDGGEIEEARLGSCASPECAGEAACNGDAVESFCDDCNPCTVDANCTPCSALPAEERDLRHCTMDEDLPPFCAGHTGCVHLPLTTPAFQINACFPVANDPDLHAGACQAGVCVENDR